MNSECYPTATVDAAYSLVHLEPITPYIPPSNNTMDVFPFVLVLLTLFGCMMGLFGPICLFSRCCLEGVHRIRQLFRVKKDKNSKELRRDREPKRTWVVGVSGVRLIVNISIFCVLYFMISSDKHPL